MNITIGDRIKALREDREITQEQVAARLQTYGVDVTRNWVSAVERGRNRIPERWVCALAAALETDPNALFGWDEFRRLHRS